MKSKRGMEMSFNVIVVAIISLLVLIIIIAIFREQTSGISDKFTQIREKETDETAINSIFGCDEGAKMCKGNAIYICKNNEFTEDITCNNKCKDGTCV